jgi:selenocysteine lyase/cysteine desulfurase
VSDPAALRSQFPVLERVSYLNAGTNGPIPRRAVDAARESLAEQAENGRGGAPFFEAAMAAGETLRNRVADVLGCDPAELALTGSTTDGVNAVLSALELGPGDEVLTSDEEHPGILAPLAGQRDARGVSIRVVPFDEVADEVRPQTKLVAVSHVSWITGRVIDSAALAAAGAPVLLDGAQGIGAVPVDVRALGCDYYAASGQKWMCGPNGLGYLYVRGERIRDLGLPWPSYGSLADPANPLDSALEEAAKRFDTGIVPPHHSAWAVASLDVLDGPGLQKTQQRASDLAARLARLLAERGKAVAPRGDCTLVSWEDEDPPAQTERLFAEGIVVRHLPGTPYVRASVGAWSDEDEIERLVALAT